MQRRGPGPRPRREETGPALPGSLRRRPVSASSRTFGNFGRGSEAPLPRVRNVQPWRLVCLSGQSVGAGPISRAEAELNRPDACGDRGTRAGSGRASDSPARACTYGRWNWAGSSVRRGSLGSLLRDWGRIFLPRRPALDLLTF